jgi:hypothetical protein
MLSTNLTTNEVRNSAGTEVEFNRLSSADRKTVFAQSGETPSLPHRITVSHQESGSGLKGRRRSLIRVDKTSLSTVDSVTPVVTSAYIVLDAPVGALTANTEMKTVLAELTSLVAGNGTLDLLKYDGTGNGAAALLDGTI